MSLAADLEVASAGAGRPIVLIHGLGGTQEGWAATRDGLLALGRVVTGDQRGHGRFAQVFSPAWAAGHPEALDAYRARAGTLRPDVLRRAVDACRGHDCGDALSALRVPAMVMVGALDVLTPPALSRRLAAALGTEPVGVPGVAHAPHLEAPDRFLAHVGAWLGDG